MDQKKEWIIGDVLLEMTMAEVWSNPNIKEITPPRTIKVVGKYESKDTGNTEYVWKYLHDGIEGNNEYSSEFAGGGGLEYWKLK